MFYRKVGTQRGNSHDALAVRYFEADELVRPVEVETREKVPGERSVEVNEDDACDVFGCCEDCLLTGFNNVDCPREDYTWTLTATPKKA